MTWPIIEQLRTLFNHDVGTKRVVAFLSPTCGPCRYGQGVVRALFEEFPEEKMAGYIIWVPMLPNDNAESALGEQKDITDRRIRCWFDADKAAANAWSACIGLPSTTWDVYAIYDQAALWSQDAPPVPNIWMHQLNPTPATRVEDRLDTNRLARAWLAMVAGTQGTEEQLATRLHAMGQRVSNRETGSA